MAFPSFRAASSSPPPPPADLTVVDNEMVFADDGDRLEHLWFHLVEREAGSEYPLHRVVCLEALRYLPQEQRQDAGLLDTMRTCLTGLYNQRSADYDPCMVVAGIFDPPLGVVQCYGAVGIAEEKERAVRNAHVGMAAVEGVMANFVQSRLEPLDIQKAEWLRRAFLEMDHSLVVIGQPDPRLSARGMGREGPAEKSVTMTGETAYTMQQNEMLFRALASLQEEFLFLVLASRLAQGDLAAMLEGVAAEASVPASRQTGAKSITFGLSFPLMASGSLGQSTGAAYGRSEGQSASEGVAESESTSHVEGHATTVGHSVTDGTAHTEGHATSSGGSSGTSISVVEGTSRVDGTSQGTAETSGSAHTVGRASSSGGSSSHSSSITSVPAVTSRGGGESHSQSAGFSAGRMHTEGANWGASTQRGESHAAGKSWNAGVSGGMDVRAGGRAQLGDGILPAAVSVDGSVGVRGGVNAGVGGSESDVESSGRSVSAGGNVVDGVSGSVSGQTGSSRSSSWSTTPAHSIRSSSSSRSSFHSSTRSEADTTSQAHTESQGSSQADGASRSVATTTSRSSFHSSTHSSADTTSHSETSSWAKSESVADGESRGVSRSRSSGRTSGTSIGRALGIARTMGMGAGVVPSVAASKSYQWWDDKAVQVTAILRAQEELLRQSTLEGAYLTDAYLLCRTERGAAAAEAAVRQAFHGSELPVVTPVQTRWLTEAEQRYIRLHAMCFTQSTREETVAGALEAYKDSTLLLPLQLAAYMAPALFEEGAAMTTQERIPSFAFDPDMKGDVVLAHQWSTDTGRLTRAQLRLSEERMFHTAFGADTGYGKTVAAERLAVETTRLWKYRTIVLDFGAGWRRMLNAPLGEPGRVEVYQVFPGATAPFRWNPLQIGKRINPERQMRATCELMRNAGQMGPRQLGFMRRTLKELYLKHGVLTSFREVLADGGWNTVLDVEEWGRLDEVRAEWGLEPRGRERGLHLADLEPFERQALAVHRSKAVDLVMWYQALEKEFKGMKKGSPDHTSLQGVLLRLEPFVEGEMERMYGRGEGSLAIEELGLLGPADDQWGIAVLEGGAEMEDEFAKAVIFGLVAWHLYHDAVVRRRRNIGRGPQRKLQIFFEEANKVLSGVAVDTGDRNSGGGGQTSEIWQVMWRDGRKYGIWLHPIFQTASEMPTGILSSCNNAFFSQTKAPPDRDLMMAHLAFSEKGFTDEDYKRFISRMAIKMAICKLGYSDDILHTTPFLCRPVMVTAQEPTDAELLARHQTLQRARRRKN